MIAQELNISHVRVWRTINAECLYLYKVTSTPELLPGDVKHFYTGADNGRRDLFQRGTIYKVGYLQSLKQTFLE